MNFQIGFEMARLYFIDMVSAVGQTYAVGHILRIPIAMKRVFFLIG